MSVHLVTCAAMPGLHHDDRHLLVELSARGIGVEPVVWEDQFVDWAAAPVTVIRSTWDYAYRRPQFVAWARRIARVTRLWNSANLVDWNTHKQYLVDLAERGVPTVETVVLPAGSRVQLADEMDRRGWKDCVLKAAVAQSGRYAMRVRDVLEGQAHLDRLLPSEDMLLQPYVSAIEHTGEVSVVWIDGEITHAIRKRSMSADFRVHSDYGGSVALEDPAPPLLQVAEAAVASLPERPLYARADLVEDAARGPLIMEFEVVEPELFFGMCSAATARFATAIERLVSER